MNRFAKTIFASSLGALALLGARPAAAQSDHGDLKEEILKEVNRLIDRRFEELRRDLHDMLHEHAGAGTAEAKSEAKPRREAKERRQARAKIEEKAKDVVGDADRLTQRLQELKKEALKGQIGGGPTGSGQGYLGIRMEADGGEGIEVTQVVEDSPADRAGLKAGDRIVGMNGRPIESTDSLRAQVEKAGAGSKVAIDVIRKGRSKSLTAKLGSKGEGALAGSTSPTPDQPAARAGGGRRTPPADAAPPAMPEEYREKRRRAEREEPRRERPEREQKPGFLGVNIADSDEGGVHVTGLVEGQAAQRGGIREGDVVVGIDGRPVKDINDLIGAVSGAGAGTRIKIKVRRGNEERVIAVRLGERPDALGGGGGTPREPQERREVERRQERDQERERKRRREERERERDQERPAGNAWMGITIEEVDEVTREVLGLEGSEGILVDSVRDDSPAEAAGLERADLILSFGGKAVGSGASLGELVRSRAPGDEVSLEVLRKGDRLTLTIVLGERKN